MDSLLTPELTCTRPGSGGQIREMRGHLLADSLFAIRRFVPFVRDFWPPLALRRRLARHPDVTTRLTALAASLNELIRETEPEFVQLAGGLKSLHSCASTLGKVIASHVSSVQQALEQTRLTGSGSLASCAVEQLEKGLAEISLNLESLGAIGASLGLLHRKAPQIERIATSLQASVCGFAVESARTSACLQAFGPFVEELRQLAGEIRSVGETIGDQAKSVQGELETLIRGITADTAQLQQLTTCSEETLRRTSGEMQQLLDSYWAALQQAESRTLLIARHADEAAYHIQFGDIVRQKLEHVETALAEAIPLLSENSRTGQASRVLRLQAAQLDLVCREIGSARDQLAVAFAGLASETGNMVSGMRALEGAQEGDRSGTNVFADLETNLLSLDDLQSRGRKLCGAARSTSQDALASSSRIAEHVDRVKEMNFHVHLQALNAIIKTELLGDEGRTLGVLSMHVHSMSNESSLLADETASILERIEGHSASFDPASSDQDFSAELKGGLEAIGRVQLELQEATGAAAGLGETQSARLEQVRQRLDFLTKFEQRLAAIAAEIASLQHSIQPLADALLPADEASSVSQRYTMQSERDVHSILEQHNQAAGPQQSGFEAPGDELECVSGSSGLPDGENGAPAAGDSFGDNVDLF